MIHTRSDPPSLNPLWARSPLALLRYPGLFAAIAGGALLLALAAASFPLFLSASQASLLRSGIDAPIVTPYGAGIAYSRTNVLLNADGPGGTPLVDEMATAFDGLAADGVALAPPLAYVFGSTASVTEPGGAEPPSGPISGRLVAADDALEHVRPIVGEDGDGVWIPDLIADAVGAGPGDEIRLEHAGRSLLVPVDGVYRALYDQRRDGYWLQWSDDVYLDPSCFDCPAPPQPILADRAQVLDWTRELGPSRVDVGWVAPLRDVDRLSLDTARAQERSAARARARASDRADPAGSVLRCCGRQFSVRCCFGITNAVFVSSLHEVLTLVDRRTMSLETAGRLLRGAGIVVALVVIAAAGAFAHAARRTEATLQYARGVTWASVAARSALESVIPCLLGGAVGFGLAVALVGALGPDASTSPSAVRDGLWSTIAAVVGALIFLGGVSAVSYLRRSEHHRVRARVLARIPWELLLAALAVVLYLRIRDQGVFGGADLTADEAQPSLVLLVFPIVFIAGFGTLAARLFVAGVGLMRGHEQASHARYLAVRRLAGAAGPSRVLIAATALCLGIFVQSQVMVGSLRATVEAKAKVYVGSDVQGRINLSTPLPASMPLPFTTVTRQVDAGDLPGGRGFDLLVVDPDTFADAAFWRDTFSDTPLPDLLARLAGDDPDPLRAIVVRGPGIRDGATVQMQEHALRLHVVGRAEAFPGMTSLHPMLVVDGEALAAAFADAQNPLNTTNASRQLWVRGNPAEGERALAALEYPPYLILSAEEVESIPAIATAIETFLVLNALGLCAALLAVAGTLMYLQARQRSQVVSYGLSVRMGMGVATYRWAIALEFGTMLVVGGIVGTGLALLAGALVIPTIDPLPTIPPGPLLVAPLTVVGLAGICVLVLTWAGAWLTSVRARRADLGEVMRLA
jgi:putative ABC transport system permease protein